MSGACFCIDEDSVAHSHDKLYAFFAVSVFLHNRVERQYQTPEINAVELALLSVAILAQVRGNDYHGKKSSSFAVFDTLRLLCLLLLLLLVLVFVNVD